MIFPSDKFVTKFKQVSGALSVSESIAIINVASKAPVGLYAEFGVYHGKSAMSALQSLKGYQGYGDLPKFILCDPIFEDKSICDLVRGNLDSVKNKTIDYVFTQDMSFDEIVKHDNYAYIMIDSGSHQDGLPMREVKLIEDRMVSGGVIVFHDWNSQFSEVKEAADYLVSTGKYDYMPIDWEVIIAYVGGNDLEKGNDSWHHTEMAFPNFVGAVMRK